MNDKTTVHITKAIKNGGAKCWFEILASLECSCWSEVKRLRNPPFS